MKGLERVRRARSQLILETKAIFYACLALELELEASTKFDTMAVAPTKLFVNEAYADSLTDAKLRGVLVHEVKHLAYGHHVRRGNRDFLEWNEACDYRVNGDCIAEGYELPDDALVDPKYNGMIAEEIYAVRRAEKEKQQKQGGGQTPGSGKPGCGEVLDAVPSGNEADLAEEKARMQAKVFNAAAVAAKAGHLPASMARLIEEQRKPPKASWRDILRQFVDQSVEKEFSWSRPNRRFIGQGLYLPALVSDAAAHMLTPIDTSGSINDKALGEFTVELNDIMGSGCVDKITAIYCDTELAGETEFERGDEIKLNAIGGGGTSFAPVMTWAADKQASCMIYFTDLECYEYGVDPGIPVLWATWSSQYQQPPFGEVIVIDPYDR